MKHIQERLRRLESIIEAQAELLYTQIEHVREDLKELESKSDVPKCPECGETEKLEDTPAGGVLGRVTCLSCGTSHYPGVEEALKNG